MISDLAKWSLCTILLMDNRYLLIILIMSYHIAFYVAYIEAISQQRRPPPGVVTLQFSTIDKRKAELYNLFR